MGIVRFPRVLLLNLVVLRRGVDVATLLQYPPLPPMPPASPFTLLACIPMMLECGIELCALVMWSRRAATTGAAAESMTRVSEFIQHVAGRRKVDGRCCRVRKALADERAQLNPHAEEVGGDSGSSASSKTTVLDLDGAGARAVASTSVARSSMTRPSASAENQGRRSLCQGRRRRGNDSGNQSRHGRKKMAGHPGERITQGLERIARSASWSTRGRARFAKWRAVLTVGAAMRQPWVASEANMSVVAVSWPTGGLSRSQPRAPWTVIGRRSRAYGGLAASR